MSRHRKKNRKREVEVPRTVGSIASTLVLAGVIAMAYLYLGNRCNTLGNEMASLEKEYSKLEQTLRVEESRWGRMKSVPGVKAALQHFNLNMDYPEPSRIVHLRELPLNPESLINDESPQYAQLSANIMHE